MRYVAQAGSEIGKPLRFVTELGVILLLLSDSGINIPITIKIITYIILMFVAFGIGIVLGKMGIIKYNATLTNNHNPELQEILSLLRKKDGKRHN